MLYNSAAPVLDGIYEQVLLSAVRAFSQPDYTGYNVPPKDLLPFQYLLMQKY